MAIASGTIGAAATAPLVTASASTTLCQRWMQPSRRATALAALVLLAIAGRAVAALATASGTVGAAATDPLARARASITLYTHWLQPSRRTIASVALG